MTQSDCERSEAIPLRGGFALSKEGIASPFPLASLGTSQGSNDGHDMKIDEVYMSEALKEAQKAFDLDEVAVGAIIVHERKIIARAHNQTRLLKDPTAHAEMIALTQAANFLKNERLLNCALYVTIEPCPMCAGAMIWARIKRVIFGAPDPKAGACGSVMDILGEKRLNHRISVRGGILPEECGWLISKFFQNQRAKGKK